MTPSKLYNRNNKEAKKKGTSKQKVHPKNKRTSRERMRKSQTENVFSELNNPTLYNTKTGQYINIILTLNQLLIRIYQILYQSILLNDIQS